jgi:AcrR family transcriptional regulator
VARPRTPLLSPSGIRSAALARIDRDGLDGFSMRRLARDLGVSAASLYGHVPTKEALLDDLAEEVMASVDTSGFDNGDWRHGLVLWARSFRTALAAHPNLVPYVALGPGRQVEALRRADAVHGGLTHSGWPPRHATMIGAATKYLVVGAAIASFSRGFSDDAAVYLGHYPNLGQAHLLAQHADEIDADSFELALSAFLDGLTRLRATLEPSVG